MGRKVRMVPPDWEHPKKENGKYIPLYEGPYEKEASEWYENAMLWQRGEHPSQIEHPELTKNCFWHEWNGMPPEHDGYTPGWPDEERTHYQMYEDTSEGTPISPPMETPEKLAQWLADNNASSFADRTATYEQWLTMIKAGWAISAVGIPGKGLMSGVEFSND